MDINRKQSLMASVICSSMYKHKRT